jgi:hypothetical protein
MPCVKNESTTKKNTLNNIETILRNTLMKKKSAKQRHKNLTTGEVELTFYAFIYTSMYIYIHVRNSLWERKKEKKI